MALSAELLVEYLVEPEHTANVSQGSAVKGVFFISALTTFQLSYSCGKTNFTLLTAAKNNCEKLVDLKILRPNCSQD